MKMANKMTDVTPAQTYGFAELFGFSNSYTRQRYWAVIVCAFLANMLVSFTIGLAAAALPPLYVLVIVIGLMFSWISFVTTIKRLRDAGVSLYWSLLSFIPLLGWIAVVVFGCIGSSETKNNGRVRGVIASAVALVLAGVIIMGVGIYAMYNSVGAEYGTRPAEAISTVPAQPASVPAVDVAPARSEQ